MRPPLHKEWKMLSLIFLGVLWISNLTNYIVTFKISVLIVLIALTAMIIVVFLDKKY